MGIPDDTGSGHYSDSPPLQQPIIPIAHCSDSPFLRLRIIPSKMVKNSIIVIIPVALFTKILTIKNCRKCKTKIKKSFTKILTIILSVKIVLTLRVKLPCPKCKILIVREILVLSFIVSEKNRKKDGRCIGAST